MEIGKSLTMPIFVDTFTVPFRTAVHGVSDGKDNLLMAKGRNGSAETLFVPRIELPAALRRSRLTKYVRKANMQEVAIASEHVWCDGQAALRWIHSNAHSKLSCKTGNWR